MLRRCWTWLAETEVPLSDLYVINIIKPIPMAVRSKK
jgi:hypothetical protein